MILKLLLLGLSGIVGTLARYGLAGFVHRIDGSAYPWGTFAVNIIGCFLAGLLFTLFESKWPVSGNLRTAVLIGFLGSFTTFSAFILETGEMMRTGAWLYASANIISQNVVGILFLYFGILFARLI